MLTLFALTTLVGMSVGQVVENTVFGTSTESTCPSSQVSDTDNGACATSGTCGAASKWLVETVSATATMAEVSLIPGRLVGQNALEMYVTHGAVNGRTVDKITVNGPNEACNYPGVNWVKGVDSSGETCFDVYRATIPWTTAYVGGADMAAQNARGCGLKRSQNATHVEFEGQATITFTEEFEFDGNKDKRTQDQVVRFKLVQPRTITDISVTVAVLEDPRLLQAITEQSFDYVSGKATLKLKISTADPLLTVAEGMKITQPDKIGIAPAAENPLVAVAGCDESFITNQERKSCLQEHTFELDPKEACDFDGEYKFDINVACRPDVVGKPECPLEMTTKPLSISVTLDSENICTVVEGLLEVDAAMTTHGTFDSATFEFGPDKNTFFQSQTIQFKLVAESLNEFPFQSTTIEEVRATATAGGSEVVIYNREKSVSEWGFKTSSDQKTSATVHTHQFELSASSESSFGVVTRNNPIDAPIEADISLVFANSIGPGPGTRKRATIRIAPEQLQQLRKRQMVNNERAATAGAIVTFEPAADAPDAADLTTAAGGTTNAAGDTTTAEENATATDEVVEIAASVTSLAMTVLAVALLMTMA